MSAIAQRVHDSALALGGFPSSGWKPTGLETDDGGKATFSRRASSGSRLRVGSLGSRGFSLVLRDAVRTETVSLREIDAMQLRTETSVVAHAVVQAIRLQRNKKKCKGAINRHS